MQPGRKAAMSNYTFINAAFEFAFMHSFFGQAPFLYRLGQCRGRGRLILITVQLTRNAQCTPYPIFMETITPVGTTKPGAFHTIDFLPAILRLDTGFRENR